ncbi:hypothetical protein Barb7_03086 [Bacteroidales bacterium Barb7]|nr:hypothetical protein Barb7_03086 [Bacteroidales bacterium Barb7]
MVVIKFEIIKVLRFSVVMPYNQMDIFVESLIVYKGAACMPVEMDIRYTVKSIKYPSADRFDLIRKGNGRMISVYLGKHTVGNIFRLYIDIFYFIGQNKIIKRIFSAVKPYFV